MSLQEQKKGDYMEKKELVSINKNNRALAKLLEDITQCQVKYEYFYKKSHWEKGYAGETGFLIENYRFGLISFLNNDELFYTVYCGNLHLGVKEFRILTIDEVRKDIEEKHSLHKYSKNILYLKMMMDAYFDKKTEKKAKVKL